MIPYIINVALILTGCLVFYKLLLQKETFYRLNRYVLITCLIISFGLPLLPIPQQWSFRKADTTEIITVPEVSPVVAEKNIPGTAAPVIATSEPVATSPAATESNFSLSKILTWMFYLYWFGVIAFGLNFLVQVIVLMYRAYKSPVIIDGNFRIVEVSGEKAPCSFGNNIFINPEKYDWDTYEQIIKHEKVHIRQKHTLDILFAELVLVFQWFNPFAWTYRKEIENNLEFLTDDELVQREKIEPASYQMSLLKVSTPHLPLSLTTNYNQSLLKKRIVMMNAKRSNVHTAWKYFFLLPVLALFACLFNEPMAQSGNNRNKNNNVNVNHDDHHKGMSPEGVWFATIKEDRINIRFQSDDDEDHGSFSSTTFKLSDFTELPQGTEGNFKTTREAGSIEFKGKFDGKQGMGRYKFVSNKEYAAWMNKQNIGTMDEDDLMAFFFVDVKKDYVKMLKDQGYNDITKSDLLPLAALNIDEPYIKSMRNNGFKDISHEDLIPLKSLGVDATYLNDIRSAGYPNLSVSQAITFKAQGIDKDYIMKMKKDRPDDVIEKDRSDKGKEKSDKEKDKMNHSSDSDDDADDLVAFKALGIDDAFINSFKSVGYSSIPNSDLIALKSLGVTPEYIRSFQNAGFTKISISDYAGLKSQNLTPEFIRSFESVGFKDISVDDALSAKVLGVTPEYIKAQRAKGFNYTKLEKYITLRSLLD